VHISIAAIMREDTRLPRGDQEFQSVQVGKALHRLRSGTHIVHEMVVGDRRYRNELHKYPKSAGRVLRIIGQRVEDICEHTTATVLDNVIALKVKRYDVPKQQQQQHGAGASKVVDPTLIAELQTDDGYGVVVRTNEGRSYRIIPRTPAGSPPEIGHEIERYVSSQNHTVFPL
jgi:hypothetical protein